MHDGTLSVTVPNAVAAGRPVVTIGMPVFNSERFLAASLDTLLAQDLTDFELVISDNASTDGSGEIARRYAKRDPRILYVRQPRNIGAVANWNYLVHAARGRYFKWSSSNDLCAPDLLSRCVTELEADPGLVLCYGRTALIDDDGRLLEEYAHDTEILDERPSVRFRRACREMRLNNAQCSVMRLDQLRRTGLEREFPEGDMPLMAELALRGGFRRLDTVLLFRRMGKNSATRFMTPEQKSAFRNPEVADKHDAVVWSATWDYLKSLWRTPLSWRERFAASEYVFRQLYWSRGAAVKEIRDALEGRAGAHKPAKKRKLALLGAYSSKNFGDTAIQAAAIHHLGQTLGDVELVGISHDAVDTLATHGISGWTLQAEPGRPSDPKLELGAGRVRLLLNRARQLHRMWRVAAQIDVMVISGSGQLEDYWGGPWGHAFTLYAWTLAFRLRGKPVAVLATGLDDLSTSLGRSFILRTLRRACYRSFRDAGTLEKLRLMGFAGRAHVCPDLAFSYPAAREARAANAPRVIVVCPISHRAFRREPPGVYEKYLDALGNACVSLAAQGHAIRLTNSQVDMDAPLLHEFYLALSQRIPANQLELVESRQVTDFLAIVSQADLVIASRLHALILSAVMHTPAVAVSYSRKVTQLMTDIESADFCLALSEAGAEQIVRMATQSIAADSARRERLTNVVTRFATALQSEYRAILALLYGRQSHTIERSSAV